ncbi:hypothetical protein ACFYNX_27365 [Streptomyces sp. NPDC007872]|uniref:hypothetical protein n=1 Tax=Streptomyces sp. NPDC007872 TaxID=3364782 RepID=UPI00369A48C2
MGERPHYTDDPLMERMREKHHLEMKPAGSDDRPLWTAFCRGCSWRDDIARDDYAHFETFDQHMAEVQEEIHAKASKEVIMRTRMNHGGWITAVRPGSDTYTVCWELWSEVIGSAAFEDLAPGRFDTYWEKHTRGLFVFHPEVEDEPVFQVVPETQPTLQQLTTVVEVRNTADEDGHDDCFGARATAVGSADCDDITPAPAPVMSVEEYQRRTLDELAGGVIVDCVAYSRAEWDGIQDGGQHTTADERPTRTARRTQTACDGTEAPF